MSDPLIFNCIINEPENSLPVISLLAERFPYHDSEQWLRIINDGHILLNGTKVTSGHKVCSGDTLTYQAIDHHEPEVSTEIEQVWESPELLLVGKPAGTPVTRTGVIVQNTFVNILRRHYDQDIHPLHRLDRETSGLLLCARNREACRYHQTDLKNIMAGKFYLAVVRGCIDQQTITVDQPLATREDSPVRCRMWVSDTGKPSQTIFHVIATTADRTLIVAELKTGRRHQIRAHLAHLGHSLVGDKIYTDKGKYFLKRLEKELVEEDYRRLGARNHTLHAWGLNLKLPGQPEKMFFSEHFSEDMRNNLKLFPGWKEKAADYIANTALAPEKDPKDL